MNATEMETWKAFRLHRPISKAQEVVFSNDQLTTLHVPMKRTSNITFGDKVRLRSTPETEALGVASLIGQVFGETTPSATGVTVVGKLVGDYALNVHFEGRPNTLWFTPELLEFVDHGAGSEISLDGVQKKLTRNENGEWVESLDKKPWWRFW